ncbi:MAG: tyrosine-type recombinase/integrase [Bacteroidetes bacterium]|nr:tyrosine-type recombinase/integrase [Bacteroidota bacterium]
MSKPLQIPKGKKLKGLIVFCNHCKQNVEDICKESKKKIKDCAFGKQHVFKVIAHVSGSKNQRKTKSLSTINIDEAIMEAIRFQQEVKECKRDDNLQTGISTFEKREGGQSEINKDIPVLLIECIAKYVSVLRGENVPEHLKVNRSEDYLKDIERHFERLIVCLETKKINTETLQLQNVNDSIVGLVYEYLLQDKQYSNRTFNKSITIYSSLFRWFNEEYNTQIRNPFNKVKRKKTHHTPKAITKEQYEQILNQITPENGIRHYEKGVKKTRNLFQPWLKDAIRLGAYSGRRREELLTMKYSDIIEDKDGVFLIKVEDIKVNRIQKREGTEEKKYNYVPVTPQLMELLNELGFEKHKGTDTFLIAPDLKSNRNKVMVDSLTRGFSHYADQVAPEENITFKSIRKTYASQMQIATNGNARQITGHSSDAVLKDHYIDPQLIAKMSREFEIFPSDSNRESELEKVRSDQQENKKGKELNR